MNPTRNRGSLSDITSFCSMKGRKFQTIRIIYFCVIVVSREMRDDDDDDDDINIREKTKLFVEHHRLH